MNSHYEGARCDGTPISNHSTLSMDNDLTVDGHMSLGLAIHCSNVEGVLKQYESGD